MIDPDERSPPIPDNGMGLYQVRVGKVQRMECIMPDVAQAVNDAPGEMGIDQKFHSSIRSLSNQLHTFDLAQPRGERKRCQHVVTF